MNVVWFSWKDIKHPLAGGAERVTDNLLRGLVHDGHTVKLITSRPPGAASTEIINGYQVIRHGSRYGVYWHSFRYYRKHLQRWADIVFDEVNTIPFFACLYSKKPTTTFIHQLAGKVWFYQMKQPLSRIGFWLEPFYLRLLRSTPAITISNSTRQDLIKVGFAAQRVSVIREGIELIPIKQVTIREKYPRPTLLSLGSVRPMKRTIDIFYAFEHAKQSVPELRLIIAGNLNGSYGRQLTNLVDKSRFRKDIDLLGSVSIEKKRELMLKSHLMAITSIKEGWCLTVTEANSQGTPVVAYNVDGLRDSIKNGETGLITPESPVALGEAIAGLIVDPNRLKNFSQLALEDSRQYTFDLAYQDFKKVVAQNPE